MPFGRLRSGHHRLLRAVLSLLIFVTPGLSVSGLGTPGPDRAEARAARAGSVCERRARRGRAGSA